jgi:hypothetical protein
MHYTIEGYTEDPISTLKAAMDWFLRSDKRLFFIIIRLKLSLIRRDLCQKGTRYKTLT